MTRRRNPQTETPASSAAFRRWFGDSKVVDARGEPLVVYHGSPEATFTSFRATLTDQPKVMFSGSREIAETYTRKGLRTRPGVYAVYLRIENPLVVDVRGANWDNIPLTRTSTTRYQLRKHGIQGPTSVDALAYLARRLGYDGLVVKNVVDVYADNTEGVSNPLDTTYVVFSPKQIKSATANVGTFDPADPSILRNPVQGIHDENVHLKGTYGTAEDVFFGLVQQQFDANTDIFLEQPEGTPERTLRTVARRRLRTLGINPKARAYAIDFLNLTVRGKGSGSRIVGEIEKTLRDEGEQVVFLIAARLFADAPHSRGFWKRMGYTEISGNYEPLVWEFGNEVEDDRIMFKVL